MRVRFSGNPAIVGLLSLRPVALRLRLSTDLPFFSRSEYAQNKNELARARFLPSFDYGKEVIVIEHSGYMLLDLRLIALT